MKYINMYNIYTNKNILRYVRLKILLMIVQQSNIADLVYTSLD